MTEMEYNAEREWMAERDARFERLMGLVKPFWQSDVLDLLENGFDVLCRVESGLAADPIAACVLPGKALELGRSLGADCVVLCVDTGTITYC